MYTFDIQDSNKETLNAFLKRNSDIYIHQSYEWTKFQNSLNSRVDAGVFCIGEKESDIVCSCAYTVIKTVFGKTYVHVNRGPVVKGDMSDAKLTEISFLLIERLESIAEKNKSIYIRYDFPFEEENILVNEILKLTKPAHYTFQPVRTLMLDLNKTEEELLKEMKPKGRYNIRLAKKKGVNIRVSNDLKDLGIFFQILKTTCTRDGFSVQPFSFYEDMLKNLKDDQCKIYLAEYEGKVIAANIMTFFGVKSTYYYGASSNEYRNLMSPYLLQWQAICDAKNAGYKRFDFLGSSSTDRKDDPWAGITDFKRKFGGMEVKYLTPREQVNNKLFYYLVVYVKALRNIFAP